MKLLTLVALSVFTFAGASYGQTEKVSKRELRKETKEIEKEKKNFKGDPNNPITFTSLIIEKDQMPYGSANEFSFEFKNTGVDSLEIQAVRPSCGCTQAKKPESKVAPGESSVISVSYDTKREGAFTKSITVMTNKTEPIVLTIKGSVLPKQ